MKHLFDAWERRVLAFGISPWSSITLFCYSVCWIGAEAARGKWIGWDGALTIAAAEFALAAMRAINKRNIK